MRPFLCALLLLAGPLALAAEARENPSPELGFVVQLGSASPWRGVHVLALNPFLVEGRVFVHPQISVDVRTDWVYLLMSRGLTSKWRLPIAACAHWRYPLGQRWNLGIAGGLEAAFGSDAHVADELLAHRAGGQLALQGKVGFERARRTGKYTWGTFLSSSRGGAWSLGQSDRIGRFVLESTFTWRLGE